MVGAATNGVDYQTLPGTITIPAGAGRVAVTLTAIPDAHLEGAEGAVLSITAGAGYTVGVPGLALATIADSIVVEIAATDAFAAR